MSASPVDWGTVLVTGGTGSFGGTKVRRLLKTDVSEIRIFSRDELKQHDMRAAIADQRARFYRGDVRNRSSVDRAMDGQDCRLNRSLRKRDVQSGLGYPALREATAGGEAADADGADDDALPDVAGRGGTPGRARVRSARPGDLLVRKALACTVGAKLYETLATREELARASDQGDYYRVAVDARDLNYSEYFDEGDVRESQIEDYDSHKSERLDVDVDGVARLRKISLRLDQE